MKTAIAWKILLLGAGLCGALSVCYRTFGDRGGPHFMAGLTVAGIFYLLAVRELFTVPALPRRLVVIGLVLAAVWHIEFLRAPPGVNEDIRRYVWDGRLQRLGDNPYLVIPSDPSSERLHTEETRTLNNPDLPSPYPPGAQLFFRAITAIHESTFTLRLAFVGCEFALALVLLQLLRGRHAEHIVLVYAWNPLLAIEVAGSGHIDIFGVLLLVISVAALARGWRTISALGLGLAVAVKFLPVVLIPLYWKRIRIRDAALAAAFVAVLYVPFLDHGRVPIGSFSTYVQNWRFNGPVFAALDHVLAPRILAGLAVLAGLATAAWLRARTEELVPELFAWPMAAALLCAPAVFPWYLLWVLPFFTSASMAPLIIWTVSIIPTYVMWHASTLGRPWGSLPIWVMPLEYGCVLIAAVFVWLYRVRKHKGSRPNETKASVG